jgi:phosphoglycerate dehydrogenase-like enzyme
MFPSADTITVCFAHVAYQFQAQFGKRNTGLKSFEVRDAAELAARIGEADVLLASGLWRNDLIALAPRLRFIQSISAGVDQYDRALLGARSIRLASAQGVNAAAVAEHAFALMLALARRLPEARDNQRRRFWRGMVSELVRREDEMGGKTLVVVGLGRIGGRLARLAKAFDMRVIGIRRDAAAGAGAGAADEVYSVAALGQVLGQADVVALTCPLTPASENLIDAAALARMKPTAHLINCARGRVVNEAALIAALAGGTLGAAGLDVTADEPLPAASPLWDMDNVLITPHTAGETQRYEDNVLDLLMENLSRLWRGETALVNQIV